MTINQFQDTINACRFCFMCRHLDPVGNVTFREADTPRGRALICDRMRMAPANIGNADYIDALYRSALSGANRFHCVSHYDESGLTLAARQDIVEAGFAPDTVKALAAELGKATFSVSGKKRPVLYYGPHPELYPGCMTISGRDPGKALDVLGFAKESKRVFARFKKAATASGCKTLVVAEPSAYDFLQGKLAGVKVVFAADYLLAAKPENTKPRKAHYIESDFLRNYCGNPSAPRDLLKALGYELLPFGMNDEESYAVGEGAVVYDDLNPGLCAKLCARVDTQAAGSKTPFITASQAVKDTLKKYQASFNVLTLEEAAALCL
jgi:Fe-S oxidoreductase